MPALQPRYYGIQILRGLAAIFVVLHHQAEAAGDLFPHVPGLALLMRGSMGVDIFFPISGFVMYLSASAVLARPHRPGDWQAFAWRRIARVAPMYWLFTVLKLAVFFALPALLLHYQFRLWNTIAAFLFLPALNYMQQPEPPLVVGWTLAYEMLFYVILTLAIALRKPLLAWSAAIIGVLAAVGVFLPHRWGALTYLADPIELEFLAGMLIAACASRLRVLPAWLAGGLFLASLAYMYGAPMPMLDFQPLRALYWGIPGALLVLAVVALEARWDLSRSRLLLLLGDASYSLYLTHTFVVPATRALAARLYWRGSPAVVTFFVGGLLLCLVVAVVVHLSLELPLLARMTRRVPWSARSEQSA